MIMGLLKIMYLSLSVDRRVAREDMNLHGTQNGSVVGVAQDVLLIAKVTELFICATLWDWLDREVVAAFHTANRSSGLVHELHCERKEGRKEGSWVGGKSVDDSFSHG